MFGGIMALPDGFIDPLFRGCTRVPMREIERLHISGVGARDAKLRLAREIVAVFWGPECAGETERAYVAQFREKEVPDDAPVIRAESGSLLAVVAQCAAASNADARRKFAQGAVSLDGERVTDIRYTLEKGKRYTLRVGRRIFIVE